MKRVVGENLSRAPVAIVLARTAQDVTPITAALALLQTGTGAKISQDNGLTAAITLTASASSTEYTSMVGRDPPLGNHLTKGEFMSMQSRHELSTFIATAVLPKNIRVYEKEWAAFKAFAKPETGSDDPFLTDRDDEKASLVALVWTEPGKLGRELGNGYRWIYYSYRGIRKVTIKDSDIHVDVVDSERNLRLYDRPMVYGICITSGYTRDNEEKRTGQEGKATTAFTAAASQIYARMVWARFLHHCGLGTGGGWTDGPVKKCNAGKR
jgi:hypothetical protein